MVWLYQGMVRAGADSGTVLMDDEDHDGDHDEQAVKKGQVSEPSH